MGVRWRNSMQLTWDGGAACSVSRIDCGLWREEFGLQVHVGGGWWGGGGGGGSEIDDAHTERALWYHDHLAVDACRGSLLRVSISSKQAPPTCTTVQ